MKTIQENDNTEISKKEKNLDKVFWFRVIISSLIGTIFGVLRFTGLKSIIFFFILLFFLTNLYFAKFLSEDDDEDYTNEVFTEGLNVGVGIFLLFWICTYTWTGGVE